MSDVDANAPVARLTLSVVVPVYNERATILQILRRVVERSEVDQVVVIDDCSADGTHDVLEAEQSRGWATLAAGLRSELPEIVLLRHEVNQGKGAALRTGFAAAIVLFHNHPTGDPSPSPDDVELTRRLRAAGVLMGIEVVDHIVLGDARYCSLKEMGQL